LTPGGGNGNGNGQQYAPDYVISKAKFELKRKEQLELQLERLTTTTRSGIIPTS